MSAAAQFDPDIWMKEKQDQANQQSGFDPDKFMGPSATVGPQLPGAGAPHPTQQQTDQAFQETARNAAKYAPGVLAGIAGITQPEFWPGIVAAGVGALAGTGVKQGTQVALQDPNAPKNLADVAKTTGTDVGENMLAEFGGRLALKPLEWAASKLPNAQSLYQSALKPRGTPEEVAKIVDTGLKEGIPVSAEGYTKAGATIDQLNKQIKDTIQAKSDILGQVIDPRHVAGQIEDVRPTFQAQVNPLSDVGMLDKVKQEFLGQHTTYAPYTKIEPSAEYGGFSPTGTGETPIIENMTPSEAQAIKQGTYKQLRNKYGELGSAEVEGQKALARGLRQDIGTLFPELNSVNARDSAMIDLEDELARYAVRSGNAGGGGWTLTGLGVATGHAPPAAALNVLKKAIDNPEIKSKLAIALQRAATSGPGRVARAAPRLVPALGHAATTPAFDPSKPYKINPNPTDFRAKGGSILDEIERRAVNRQAVLRSLGGT